MPGISRNSTATAIVGAAAAKAMTMPRNCCLITARQNLDLQAPTGRPKAKDDHKEAAHEQNDKLAGGGSCVSASVSD